MNLVSCQPSLSFETNALKDSKEVKKGISAPVECPYATMEKYSFNQFSPTLFQCSIDRKHAMGCCVGLVRMLKQTKVASKITYYLVGTRFGFAIVT